MRPVSSATMSFEPTPSVANAMPSSSVRRRTLAKWPGRSTARLGTSIALQDADERRDRAVGLVDVDARGGVCVSFGHGARR